MTGTVFDEYLQLLDNNKTSVLSFNDNTTGNDAQITYTNKTGTNMDVWVRGTSTVAGASGDYNIVVAQTKEERFRDDYELTIKNGESITLNLNTDDFDGYLNLLNKGSVLTGIEGEGYNSLAYSTNTGGTNAQLTYTNTTGSDLTAIVRASNVTNYNDGWAKIGDYQLTATTGYLSTAPLNLASTTGSLTSTDAATGTLGTVTLLNTAGTLATTDSLNNLRSGSYFDDYKLVLGAGATIQVDLTGSAFDEYLQLVNSSKTSVLTFNDDYGSDSRITYTNTNASSQEVYIRATSYASSATGSYNIKAIQTNAVTPGTEKYYDGYEFTINTGETITLNQNSSSFDTYLSLVNKTGGATLAFNDNFSGTDSQITYTNTTGSAITAIARASSALGLTMGDYTFSANMQNVTNAGVSAGVSLVNITPDTLSVYEGRLQSSNIGDFYYSTGTGYTPSANAIFSTDSSKVYFTDNTTYDLYSVNIDGSNSTNLTKGNQDITNIYGYDDSGKLLIAANTAYNYSNSFNVKGLMSLDTTNNTLTEVTNAMGGYHNNINYFDISADGDIIAYKLNASQSGRFSLSDNTELGLYNGLLQTTEYNQTWITPLSTNAAFVSDDGLQVIYTSGTKAYLENTDNSITAKELSIQSSMVNNIKNSLDFEWAHDNSSIAFTSYTSQFNIGLQSNVYTMSAYIMQPDGTGLITFDLTTPNIISQPPKINLTWTPDNSKVIAEMIVGTVDPKVLIYILPLESTAITSSDSATVNINFGW